MDTFDVKQHSVVYRESLLSLPGDFEKPCEDEQQVIIKQEELI